ncbi:hypothetical protein J5N97_024758 [Dioscorea zingiberensis]|uniref:Uncharacterized protein n=1 Tax=Dioscorea zingiberensis TaxID=325984 RepID=A0A9D5C726_9LILI|nr:hypothetical protein J5N97_024758 [Dioscorea zingiberensis]
MFLAELIKLSSPSPFVLSPQITTMFQVPKPFPLSFHSLRIKSKVKSKKKGILSLISRRWRNGEHRHRRNTEAAAERW